MGYASCWYSRLTKPSCDLSLLADSLNIHCALRIPDLKQILNLKTRFDSAPNHMV